MQTFISILGAQNDDYQQRPHNKTGSKALSQSGNENWSTNVQNGQPFRTEEQCFVTLKDNSQTFPEMEQTIQWFGLIVYSMSQ